MKKIVFSILLLLNIYFLQSQTFTESNLPLIFINTGNKAIPKENKIEGTIQVINDKDGVNNINQTDFEYSGYIGIETRGNTSDLFFAKKSFSIETRNQSGENDNVPLLGLPQENDWVLHGPYSDKSLMRNVLAYYLGTAQGRWAPRTKFCEVFLNNEYRGVYVLLEKIKIDNNRVDISKLKTDDNTGDELTGGYILRIDRHRPGCWISPYRGRTGSCEVPISYFDPEYTELTSSQLEYIKNYVTDFENVLSGAGFNDPDHGYRAYIDVISWVDYFLISELSNNLDGYRCSVYFHKDKDSKGGKLNMSPLWDYNLAFGNGNFFGAQKTEGWVADGIGNGDAYEIPFWWDRLREDPFFETHIKYRWESLRKNKFSYENIMGVIDSCAALLSEAQKRNFKKFDILNKYIWPNPYVWGNYDAEVKYLKDWMTDRLAWLDGQFDAIVPSFSDVNESFADKYQIMVHPNPFTEKVFLRFHLESDAKVQLIINNVLGKNMLNITKECLPGSNEFTFSSIELGKNENIFIYTLISNGEVIGTGKIMRF